MEVVAQLFHAGSTIDTATLKIAVINRENAGKVAELIAHGALHIGNTLIEDIGGNIVGVELIGEIGQLLQKGCTAGGLAEHLQLRASLLQTAAHGEELSALIQRKVSAAARFRQYAACKTLKTQNFRAAGGRCAAVVQQIHLRLVRSMLGHQ